MLQTKTALDVPKKWSLQRGSQCSKVNLCQTRECFRERSLEVGLSGSFFAGLTVVERADKFRSVVTLPVFEKRNEISIDSRIKIDASRSIPEMFIKLFA